MRKVCNGPMEFTPYCPWSQERRDAARERELTRLALATRRSSKGRTLPSVYSKAEWTAPVLTDVTPTPKRPWQTPTLTDISPIRPNEAAKTRRILVLQIYDERDIEFTRAVTLAAIRISGSEFWFDVPLRFEAGTYAFIMTTDRNALNFGPVDGPYEQELTVTRVADR